MEDERLRRTQDRESREEVVVNYGWLGVEYGMYLVEFQKRHLVPVSPVPFSAAISVGTAPGLLDS